jgi:hypothetical protein
VAADAFAQVEPLGRSGFGAESIECFDSGAEPIERTGSIAESFERSGDDSDFAGKLARKLVHIGDSGAKS